MKKILSLCLVAFPLLVVGGAAKSQTIPAVQTVNQLIASLVVANQHGHRYVQPAPRQYHGHSNRGYSNRYGRNNHGHNSYRRPNNSIAIVKKPPTQHGHSAQPNRGYDDTPANTHGHEDTPAPALNNPGNNASQHGHG